MKIWIKVENIEMIEHLKMQFPMLNLLCLTKENIKDLQINDVILDLTSNTIQIEIFGHKFKPLPLGFSTIQHRLGSGKEKELILKAIGHKPQVHLSILDAMAGWGRDACIFASAGHHVLSLEQQPLLAMLLQLMVQDINPIKSQHVNKLLAKPSILSIVWDILHTSAQHYLLQDSIVKTFDVIYLDPMFPSEKHGAQVKKENQILRMLAHTNHEEELEAFHLALKHAKKRVVVKRPIHAPLIDLDLKPSFQIQGKAIRFDVYIQ